MVSQRCWISRHVFGGRESGCVVRADRDARAARVSSIIARKATGISGSATLLPFLSDFSGFSGTR